jgi:tetraacyldisaccharide 4'-kinase
LQSINLDALQTRPPEQPHSRPAHGEGIDHFARQVMSGRERGVRASLFRAALAAAEPFYAAAAAGRNRLFDAGVRKSHRVPRPVISVGNITTGGTGKTPVVRWLAHRLRQTGHRIAVLARGYGAQPGQLGDEQLMLQRLLNEDDNDEAVIVVANPDRVAAATALLRDRPEIDTFVLDDGFQHRRLARDLDIVLLSATSPFGYDHVLPRGMLREPLAGLRRAGAVVVTHADQVPPGEIDAIERRVRRYHATVPVYRAIHALAALHLPTEAEPKPLQALSGRNWFAMCGIGDPQTFLRQLQSVGGRCAGHRWFADHHRYTGDDLSAVRRDARAAGANLLVTTEKDWAKMQSLSSARDNDLPIARVDVQVQFQDDGEERLWDQVSRVVERRPAGGRDAL